MDCLILFSEIYNYEGALLFFLLSISNNQQVLDSSCFSINPRPLLPPVLNTKASLDLALAFETTNEHSSSQCLPNIPPTPVLQDTETADLAVPTAIHARANTPSRSRPTTGAQYGSAAAAITTTTMGLLPSASAANIASVATAVSRLRP